MFFSPSTAIVNKPQTLCSHMSDPIQTLKYKHCSGFTEATNKIRLTNDLVPLWGFMDTCRLQQLSYYTGKICNPIPGTQHTQLPVDVLWFQNHSLVVTYHSYSILCLTLYYACVNDKKENGHLNTHVHVIYFMDSTGMSPIGAFKKSEIAAICMNIGN